MLMLTQVLKDLKSDNINLVIDSKIIAGRPLTGFWGNAAASPATYASGFTS